MRDWIKQLGYLQNIAKGSESIANQVSHLVVGVLSPLPTYAVSLRVSVGFYLGCFLELPTGALADVIGHRRTLGYGCGIVALACLGLFVACHFSQLPITIWILVLSSMFSAAGGALVSGCLQAFIQDYIDQHVSSSLSSVVGESTEELKVKALSLSQGYGNFFSALMPTFVIGGVFVSYLRWGHSEWVLLVPVATYIGLAVFFFLNPSEAKRTGITCSIAIHWHKYCQQLRSFGVTLIRNEHNNRFHICALFCLMVLSVLTVIHVHTYLMISQLRQLDLQHGGIKQSLMAFCILASFDLAHYIKGAVVPFVTKRLSSTQLLYVSLIAQCTLAALATAGYLKGLQFTSVITFVLLFRAVFTPSQNILQSRLLESIPQHLRASVFSVVQVIVLLAYGTYSAALTMRGVGVDEPQRIFAQLMCLSGAGIVITILLDRSSAAARTVMSIRDADQ